MMEKVLDLVSEKILSHKVCIWSRYVVSINIINCQKTKINIIKVSIVREEFHGRYCGSNQSYKLSRISINNGVSNTDSVYTIWSYIATRKSGGFVNFGLGNPG